MYLDIVKRKYKSPVSQVKWLERFPFLENIDWRSIYCLPYKTCRDNYSQTIQYKLLHRYTNCNYNLFKWKIIDSPNCNYCNFSDTIEHYFYECERVSKFWKKISLWLKDITEVTIDTTMLEILFGIFTENDYSYLCNYIILKGKVFICNKNKTESELFLLEFLNKLKYDIFLEREIFRNKNEMETFDKKFGILYENL